MIDRQKRLDKDIEREKTRKRMQTPIDPDNYEYYPEKKPLSYYDNDVHQRVAIYVRVSTDDVKQTTSYELQKRYYENFVIQHPLWELVDIYADEGISGTSLRHRDAFNNMLSDCKAGKIDMIICKSVSRFARNMTDCISIVRNLAMMRPPIGVFFESECIFSLVEDNSTGLGFLAIMAEEESHTRSRSMETSLRMRLDHGVPLTPKLLGYTHDAEGRLIVNPEEAPTVKLAFFMYLYGYSTQQIADAFTELRKKSYLGNVDKWTSNSIIQILRNERHCGDVLTRKTFTPDFHDHLSRKNRGERPQSRYRNHHEAIVSRDDFVAVQRLLDSAKYKNRSIMPELRVIDSGILKGFVTVHPRWAGFKVQDYYQAARSVYLSENGEADAGEEAPQEIGYQVEAQPGDFDLRGFEIARAELFDSIRRPAVSFVDRKVSFSTECVRRFGQRNYVEFLIDPIRKLFAVRPTDPSNRSGVFISRQFNLEFHPRQIPAAAFYSTLFTIFGWDPERKYRITGSLYEQGSELAYIFDVVDSEVFLKPQSIPPEERDLIHPLAQSGKRIWAVPEEWTTSFGKDFYVHERPLAALAEQSEEDWKLLMEGQLCEFGSKLNVTGFDELRSYICSQIGDVIQMKE